MSAALAVLAWFWKSPFGRTILIAAAGTLCLAFALKVHEIKVERRVRAEIEKQIKEQADAATQGATRVSDCYAAGGRWVQSTGRCVLPGVQRPDP